MSYAHRTGYAPFNVGVAIVPPKLKNTLAQRIISEADVHRMVAEEPMMRNRVLLRMLYSSGARVSELSRLTWDDVQPNGETGQVTLHGKGSTSRVVLLSTPTWVELWDHLRKSITGHSGASGGHPVFVSRKGSFLDVSAIRRISWGTAMGGSGGR